MKDQSLIHIKLDSEELLQAKRDLLRLEITLLRILKLVKGYRELRTQELEKKEEALKKMRALKKEINSILTTLPKVKIPKILEDEDEEKEEKHKPQKYKSERKKERAERKYTDEIEDELRRIQNQLRELH